MVILSVVLNRRNAYVYWAFGFSALPGANHTFVKLM